MTRRAAGEGTSYRRANGTWCAQVTFEDDNGRKRRKTVYGKTEKAVLAKKRAVQREQDDGAALQSRRAPTIKAYGDAWVAGRLADEVTSGQVRASTADSYRSTWRIHVEPLLGHHRIDALRPDHVLRWLAAKSLETSARGRPLSDRSRQYAFAVLRRVLNDAVRDGALQRNPCQQVRGPSVGNQSGGMPLTRPEATALLKVLRQEDDAALWLTLLSLGLRIGEALALRWSDIDLDEERLTVARSVSRVRFEADPVTGRHRTELVFTEPKTRRSAARLATPSALVVALRRHRALQAEARLSSPCWADEDLVFPTSIGTAQDTRNVGRRWHALRGRAGITRPIRLHDLRHSAATFLLTQGVPMRVIMETLRHSRFATTADIYTHVLDEVQATAATAMDALLMSLDTEIDRGLGDSS